MQQCCTDCADIRLILFLFAYVKTKTQISCAVTVQLISPFVFAIQMVQSLYYLNPKFQASSHLLWLYRSVCVGPSRNPEDRFSHNEANLRFFRQIGLIGINLIFLYTTCSYSI